MGRGKETLGYGVAYASACARHYYDLGHCGVEAVVVFVRL